MKSGLLATTALAFSAALSTLALANPLKELEEGVRNTVSAVTAAGEDAARGTVDILEDAGEAVLETTGLPTAVRMIEGQPLDEALQNSVENVVEGAQAAASAPAVLQPVHSATNQAIRDIGGDLAGDIHAIVTLPMRVAEQLPRVTVDWAIAAVENPENIQRLIGLPLSSALQQAHDHYDASAQPLPAPVRRMLELGGFPAATLDRARYVVDDNPNALNGLINRLQTTVGSASNGNFAVVADDIIVFARQPAFNADDFHFWAHEVTHVEQYARWGIIEFASRYTTDHDGIEREADERAEAAFQTYVAAWLDFLGLSEGS